MQVYILASRSRKLYVGVTANLPRRIYQHRTGQALSFTSRYGITRLVYYECASTPRAAIEREKRLKKWSPSKKIALVESSNPDWRDLAANWFPRPHVSYWESGYGTG